MRRSLKIIAGVVGVFVLAVIVLVGLYVVGVIQAPSGGVQDVGDWGNVSENRTQIVTTLWVNNPNPIGISIGSGLRADYRIVLNDVTLATGEKRGIAIPTGNSTVEIVTSVHNDRLPRWWVNYVQNDETIHLRVRGTVTVSALLLSTSFDIPKIDRTIQADQQPVRDALSASASDLEGRYAETVTVGVGGVQQDVTVGYEVERGWATWGQVNNDTTEVLFHYRIHNPSDTVAVPSVPDGVGVTVEMNDVALIQANKGNVSVRQADGDDVIKPGETEEVVFVAEMDNQKIDDWFQTHVRRGEQTRIETRFQVVFDVRGQTFRLPSDGGASYTCSLQTGILVDGQQTSTTCGQGGSVTAG